MKISMDLKKFCLRLGYEFSFPDLLICAVTHSSFSQSLARDNQRLEFLGDRVLGLVIAEVLYRDDSAAAEGLLTVRFNSLVCKETCAEVARNLRLGGILKFGRSEILSGGRRKQAILGDAMEAVLAAIFLDGGYGAVRSVILHLWSTHLAEVNSLQDMRDAKTMLQEWAHSHRLTDPCYTVVKQSGVAHAPIFVVQVSLKNGYSAQATAGSKRKAQQEAAALLLSRLT